MIGPHFHAEQYFCSAHDKGLNELVDDPETDRIMRMKQTSLIKSPLNPLLDQMKFNNLPCVKNPSDNKIMEIK